MSELKSYDLVDIQDYRGEVYIKSEADKVIAHHKRKRCVAMAKWCERKRIDAADYRIPRGKLEFYDKWRQRWLELAEEFKPNKSTAQ